MEKSLPKGWVRTDIEKVADILDNMRKPVSAAERAKRLGEIPYYGATGIAGYIDDFLFDEELVLVGEDGAPFLDKQKNVAFIISGKTWVNNHAHVLRANKFTLNKFLLHYLNQFDYTNFVGGTTRLKLTQGSLKLIPFPLPPLPEQERIVAKLDKLFAKHEKIKKALDRIPQLLKTFRQQVLTQAVTGKLTEQWREGKELEEWQSLLLKDIIEGTPKNGAYYPQSNYGSGVKIIRIDNFYDGDLKDWEKVKLVQASFEDIDTYGIEYNNILINRVNSIQYLGKCLLFKLKDVQCIYESNMMKIVLKPEVIYPDYAKIFLNSNIGLTELRQNAKHAVNQASINQSDVMNVNIPIPPIKEQQEIVRQVESLLAKADAIEARYQTLKGKIDNLPQAILHKAFKGELVPQLPTDGDARDLLKEIMTLKNGVKGKKKKTT